MPTYRYVAKDDSGESFEGIESASTEDVLADSLADRGLYLVEANSGRRRLGEIHIERVTQKDVILFTSQLIPVVSSGVPLLAGLEQLAETAPKHKLKQIIRNIHRDIERGGSLSEGMSKYPNVFSDMYVNTVRAGEMSGKLDESLEELLDFLEWQMELRSRVRNIMAYPAMVFALILALNVVLVTFTIPRFSQMYSQLQGGEFDLPAPTRFVNWYSNIFASYWPVILLLVLGGTIGFLLWVSTPAGRLRWDRFKLKLPVFGELQRKVAFSRFAHHFGTLYTAGIDVTTSLDVVRQALGNEYLARVVDYVNRRVRSGQTLAASMRETREFPHLVVQMVSIGETTGRMEQALKDIIRFFDREVDTSVRRVTTYMGPAMILILAGMLILMGTAFYLPLFRLVTTIQVQ